MTEPILTGRIIATTAGRVLRQLRGDHRTIALLLVVPSALLALTHEMLDSDATFDRLALILLGVFPFTTMFLVTSVAMLRERMSGTLERLLTTPTGKLDLLLGYGTAFAAAATAQAVVTSSVVYGLLGLTTPGNPALVVGIAVLGAAMGMSIGLLASAFATSEFQAVQFMPAIVMPQVLLGGLFVPRSEMAGWLQRVSDALPLTYAIDALTEVGSTSLVSGALLRDLAVMGGTTVGALALAAATLRRQAGPVSRQMRRMLVAVPGLLVLGVIVAIGFYVVDVRSTVSTDDARIEGDALHIRAPASGRLVEWSVDVGSSVRKNQLLGRVEIQNGFTRARMPVRAPADGTVIDDTVTAGTDVTAGSELAVTADLSTIRVAARIDETDIGSVRVGQRADIVVDAFPDTTLRGMVAEIQSSTAGATARALAEATEFRKVTQVVPVRITILDLRGLPLVPGMNATVRIHHG